MSVSIPTKPIFDFNAKVPSDILGLVFDSIDFWDLVACSRVCKTWRRQITSSPTTLFHRLRVEVSREEASLRSEVSFRKISISLASPVGYCIAGNIRVPIMPKSLHLFPSRYETDEEQLSRMSRAIHGILSAKDHTYIENDEIFKGERPPLPRDVGNVGFKNNRLQLRPLGFSFPHLTKADFPSDAFTEPKKKTKERDPFEFSKIEPHIKSYKDEREVRKVLEVLRTNLFPLNKVKTTYASLFQYKALKTTSLNLDTIDMTPFTRLNALDRAPPTILEVISKLFGKLKSCILH